MIIGGGLSFLLCLLFVCGLIYDRHCETRQIEAISRIEGITHEELKELIIEIKK